MVSEVLKYAPTDLTPAELVVLLVIAEQSRDDTRRCWPGQEKLMQMTRLTDSGLRRVMQRLAGRGLEVRVQIGTVKNGPKKGEPLFACNGRQANYQLPRFDTTEAGTDVPPSEDTEAGTAVPASPKTKAVRKVRKKPLKAVPIDPEGGTPVPPIPSYPLTKQNPLNRTPPAHDVDRDLFGAPIEQPNPVPMIVAAYVDSVRSSGGVATSAMCGAIGKNAKRLIDVDHLHPAVVLVSAQRAGTKRAKNLDQYLGDAQQTFDRGGESRRAMFDHWQHLHDQATAAQPEIGA